MSGENDRGRERRESTAEGDRRGVERPDRKRAAEAEVESGNARAAGGTPLGPTSGTTYKVLGELTAPEGTGVLGRNAAGSGTPVGVEGSVPNADGYGIATPDDARVEGDVVATSGHAVVVGGDAVLGLGRHGTDANGNTGGGNVVAGYRGNRATDGTVGAAIGGGGSSGSFPVMGNSRDNYHQVSGDFGTIAGGLNNRTRYLGTVGGGFGNTAAGESAAVAGGYDNAASGNYTAIGGGRENEGHGEFDAVGGGKNNTASSGYATVGGGRRNEAGRRYATVAGGCRNEATADYATIGGGGPANEFDKSGTKNVVHDEYGTVGGGGNNVAGVQTGTTGYATVAGGRANTAGAGYATVGGGRENRVEASYGTVAGGGPEVPDNATSRALTRNAVYDDYGTVGGGGGNRAGNASGAVDATFATVPGGRNNAARGTASLAAGETASADDANAFVWNDGTGYHSIDRTSDGLSSGKTVSSSSEPTGADTFTVGATGGVRVVTGTSGAVTYVPGGSAGWSQASSRAVKSDVDPVDPESVLAGVEEMGIHTWRYGPSTAEDDGDGPGDGDHPDSGGESRPRRVGPMAEDFHEAVPFDVGDGDEHINSVDADGVALAAIQGLAGRLERLREAVARKDDRIADLEAALERRDERIEALSDENSALRERLEAIETRLAAVESDAPRAGSRSTTDP